MSRYIRIFVNALLLIAGLFFCLRAIGAAEESSGVAGLWSARYESPQPLPTAWRNAEIGGESRYVLYHEASIEAEAPMFYRAKRLTFIKTAGDASLLFLPGRLVAGGYPDGPHGCVIDEESALELWGTADPSGLTVIAGGVEYEVCGVVRAARPLLLANAEEASDFAFYGVYYRGEKNDAFPRQAFTQLLATLSDATPFIEETGLLAARLRLISRLPLWSFCLIIAWRRMRAFPMVFKQKTVKIAALAAWAAVSFLILGMPNIVTPDMLPTRFSDFTFWPGRLEAALESMYTAWFLRGSMGGLLRGLELIRPVLGYSVLSAALLSAIRKKT